MAGLLSKLFGVKQKSSERDSTSLIPLGRCKIYLEYAPPSNVLVIDAPAVRYKLSPLGEIQSKTDFERATDAGLRRIGLCLQDAEYCKGSIFRTPYLTGLLYHAGKEEEIWER